MSYGLYIFAAYFVTFIGLFGLIVSSYSRYKRIKRELGKAKARAMKSN